MFFCQLRKDIDYLSANLMHNIFYDQAPSYLCQFMRVVSVHSYGTKGSEMNDVIPEIETQGKKTFMNNGARLWSSLPDSIKLIGVKYNFKKKCKNIF